MKIFHYWFQTILMIVWIVFGLLTLVYQGFWILLAFTQVIIGIVHFVGSSILMIQYKAGNLKVNIHWFGSILLIAVIVIATLLQWNDALIRILLFGVPWIPAIYFWYLSKLYREGTL
ncbi:MAG: hypothetical protein R8G66_08280 [Cytophagales bacterium]|nr:hypothetical protein [Cytophagales bacterium]